MSLSLYSWTLAAILLIEKNERVGIRLGIEVTVVVLGLGCGRFVLLWQW